MYNNLIIIIFSHFRNGMQLFFVWDIDQDEIFFYTASKIIFAKHIIISVYVNSL